MKKQDRILSNHDIRHDTVRVVEDGNSELLPIKNAIARAFNAGLDLVLINEAAQPVICHITDLNKHKYEMSQKAKANAKAQRASRIVIKEVQFKLNIDQHDFETKCKRIEAFIEKGNIVKLLIQFKGRERQHSDMGFVLVDRVIEAIDEITVDGTPQFSGNRITAILKGTPNGTKK